jgi:ABC-2 type transport system ATP-binding protein
MPALEFRGVHKTFRLGIRLKRVDAVRGVDLRVERGEVFGYLGPNGAGKSTSMKMAMGLITPTAGQIRILGRPHDERAVRGRLGFLPETPAFYDYLTAHELLDFYGRLFGLDRAVRKQRIGELLERVGLAGIEGRRLRRFSKGMLQRVGIAQALINDPELVVLDEPMSGLDPVGRKEMRDIIMGLKGQGKTVFFSSHILPDVEMVCDRVAILQKGVVEKVGRLEELLAGGGQENEVVLHECGDELLGKLVAMGARVLARGPGVAFGVEDGRLQDALRVVLDGGGRVSQVTRKRERLEDLFMGQAATGAEG